MIAWLRSLGRFAGMAGVLALLALAALIGWGILSPPPAPKGPAPTASAPRAPAPARPGPGAPGCGGEDAAAQANARSADDAAWSPFGRPERGWRVYAPLVAREIAADCPPESAGFAQALSAWRAKLHEPGGGVLDEPTLKRMATGWLLRRPFLQKMRSGCPPPPPAEALLDARPEEGYAGKQVAALAPALLAYRRMAAQARADLPELAADPRLLTIFSAYRGPGEEAARCAGGGCNRMTKASCSAHRTGTALDLYLGAAPGHAPESSDDVNRRFQTQTAAYRWLAAHADRFGFIPYPFEPWHWEWAGDTSTSAVAGTDAAQRTPRM